MPRKNNRQNNENAAVQEDLAIEKSTILLDKEVIELLKRAKDHPRQTYTELIRNMANLFISAKEKIRTNESVKKDLREQEIEDHISKELLSEKSFK